MEYTKIVDGDVCKLRMQGKFTFSDHIEFRKILGVLAEGSVKSMEIDMSGVEFVDSAALGLLLLVRDETEKKSVQLTLLKPQGQVQKMFKISRFYELFRVVE